MNVCKQKMATKYANEKANINKTYWYNGRQNTKIIMNKNAVDCTQKTCNQELNAESKWIKTVSL